MRRQQKSIRYLEPHAITRMYSRGISREQVERVVRNPDVIRPAKKTKYKLFEKRLSVKGRLTVVVEETTDTLIVVSAF